MKILKWGHSTSTPYQLETNGIAEEAVRRVKEATSSISLQSGLDELWWTESMECCCYFYALSRIFHQMGQLHTNGVLKHNSVEQKSNIILFQRKIRQVSINSARKYFVRDAGGSWKGDLLVADVNEQLEIDPSEVYLRRISTKEVLVPRKRDNFIFRSDGSAKLAGKGSEVRTSDRIRQDIGAL